MRGKRGKHIGSKGSLGFDVESMSSTIYGNLLPGAQTKLCEARLLSKQ